MKLYVLDPQQTTDLSVEQGALKNTGIELLAATSKRLDEVLESARDADAILTAHVPIGAETVPTLTKCKIIVRLGVGYDIIDLESCGERGIVVCNVPDYGTEEVASHAVALSLALHRRIPAYERIVREGKWTYQLPCPITRLSRLQVGVLGLGRIGTCFGRMIKPFVREVIAFDPFLPADDFAIKGFQPASLDQILQELDMISLHLPWSESNHHLISDQTIARMKRRPILINVSRGSLIDSNALARALRSGQISGAGIDVFEDEPNVPAEYLSLENVILTPHVAWYSEEANLQLRKSAIEEIVRVLSGQPPKNPVT